jgi:hypothetical protein
MNRGPFAISVKRPGFVDRMVNVFFHEHPLSAAALYSKRDAAEFGTLASATEALDLLRKKWGDQPYVFTLMALRKKTSWVWEPIEKRG